jgi:hypothetical protein
MPTVPALVRTSAVVVALGGSLGVASQVWADPYSCDTDRPTIGLTVDGRLAAGATAYCTKSATRSFRAEIKWSKAFAPDPLTGSYTDYGRTLYDASFAKCDHRNTRAYYARAYFTSRPDDQHDSHHRVLTVNC